MRIAYLFFRMDKVELAGTGIRRMSEAVAVAVHADKASTKHEFQWKLSGKLDR